MMFYKYLESVLNEALERVRVLSNSVREIERFSLGLRFKRLQGIFHVLLVIMNIRLTLGQVLEQSAETGLWCKEVL